MTGKEIIKSKYAHCKGCSWWGLWDDAKKSGLPSPLDADDEVVYICPKCLLEIGVKK